MNRRSFLQQTALTTGGVLLAQQQLLATLLQEPAYRIRMLRNNVGIFTERGGTIAFLLGKDGIAVVDSQFPDQSKHLISALKEKTEQPFSLLINTHHHGDHSSGNIAFKGMVGHVLAHANSKANQERVAKQQNQEANQLFPDKTYTDSWCEKTGNEEICLYYFGAGHTNGDSVIHFRNANIVHMGDLLFNRRHPFVDRSAGANIQSWIKVLDKTVNKFDKKTLYVYGHSGEGYEVTGTADDLKKFSTYLQQVLDYTAAQIKAGKSKDDILKVTDTPFESEWKGGGFNRPLQAAYEELTAG